MPFSVFLENVYVLRCIALHKPNAHRAFLYHKPYCTQYNTQGGKYELACAWGVWQISYRCWLLTAKYINKYNFRHPFLPNAIRYRYIKWKDATDMEQYVWISIFTFRKHTLENKSVTYTGDRFKNGNVLTDFWCDILRPYWGKIKDYEYVFIPSLVNYEKLRDFLILWNSHNVTLDM